MSNIVETFANDRSECEECEFLINKCSSCGLKIKRGQKIECNKVEGIHSHMKCPSTKEPGFD